MVVVVGRQHIEHHAAQGLGKGRCIELQLAQGLEQLVVAVRLLLVEIQVRHAAQRLHVVARIAVAVEALGHEMRPAALLQQVAVGHLDAGGARHQRVGVLDAAIVAARAELAVQTDAVELQQPGLIALGNIELAGAHILRGAAPGNRRLGARATGRGADLDDLAQQFAGVVAVRKVAADHRARLRHQLRHLHRGGGGGTRATAGLEGQGPHGALAHVGQAVQRRHMVLGNAALGHPGIDQRIAEAVGQRIGQQGRQALVGGDRQVGEYKRRIGLAQRHLQRRELDTAAHETRLVFKGVVAGVGVQRDRAYIHTPDVDRHGIDGPKSTFARCHVLVLSTAMEGARRLDARRRPTPAAAGVHRRCVPRAGALEHRAPPAGG
ncbi:hypothetical protein D3C71_1162840 [compost metagenome]